MMAFAPRTLVLIALRRCTAACDHCCFGSGPHAAGAIPLVRAHALIDEAAQLPSIERIVISGGECFLLGPELDTLVAHVRDVGRSPRVVSNGYWAIDDDRAAARLAPLVRAGLDELVLSSGPMHARFVPPMRVAAAARAAARAGIRTLVVLETFDGSVTPEPLAALMRERPRGIAFETQPWIPDAGGRGRARLSHRDVRASGGSNAGGACATILSMLTVTPDLRLIACCGYPLEELRELELGSVTDTRLDALVNGPLIDPLHVWLHVAGPAAVLTSIGRRDLLATDAVSVCQPCVALHGDAAALAAAQRLAALHAGELAGRWQQGTTAAR